MRFIGVGRRERTAGVPRSVRRRAGSPGRWDQPGSVPVRRPIEVDPAGDRLLRTEFAPFRGLIPAERRQIITVPSAIAKLTAVTHLVLYGTNLVRLCSASSST